MHNTHNIRLLHLAVTNIYVLQFYTAVYMYTGYYNIDTDINMNYNIDTDINMNYNIDTDININYNI